MRDLIEQLQEAAFGMGKTRTPSEPKGQSRQGRKGHAKAWLKHPHAHPLLKKHAGQHMAARSRLARMKMKKRKAGAH